MKGKQILAFIIRDLKIVFRDKVAVFWLIAWPLIWIYLVAFVFVPPGAGSPIQLDVGIVNKDAPPPGLNFTSEDFVKIMSNVTYKGKRMFNVRLYENETALLDDLKHGRIDAGIIIPSGFSLNLTTGTARIRVLIGAKDLYSASISYGVVSGFLNEFSRRIGLVKARISITYIEQYMGSLGANKSVIEMAKRFIYGIAVPINASYEEVKPETLASRENILGWYTIGGIGMMFLYTGFSAGAAAIYREKSNGTLRRILASPITPGTLIAGLMLSSIVVMLISATILLMAGVYGTGAHIVFDPVNPVHWLVPLLLFIAAYMSVGIGLLLSVFAKTEHSASSLGIALGLLLAFTAGIWFPKSWMPRWAQLLADYSPVTWVMDALRNIMVYNMGFNEIVGALVKIAIASLVILLLDIAVYRARLRKYLVS
jgi:ABC-2 type transport system permease protein